MPFEKKEKIQIVCQECGKKIYVMPWRAKKQKYCSMECYNVVKSRRLKLLHSTRNSTTIIYCQNELCKKPMVVLNFEKDKKKFCCHECFLEFSSKKHKQNIQYQLQQKEKKEKINIWKLNVE